jgi:hypothetical protein
MPSGTTPEEIVTFVLHVAKAKNELDQVMPLVRALAGASRLVHGQTVVPVELRPLVAQLYPDAARMLGFPEYIGIGEVGLNTAVQGHSDEVSSHACSSYSPTRMLMVPSIRSHLRPARINNHQNFRPIRTRPMENKRTKPSPHSNEGSPRRTFTAASGSACSPSKTHTCVRSTVSATLTRVGAARARAGSSRKRMAGLPARRP